MLYDEEFINGLPNPEAGWKSPLVAYVAKEASEQHKRLKEYFESWYEELPPDKKASYFSRLRSLSDKEFLAQIFEFFVADFCKVLGNVEFNPTLEDGKTPELLWEIQGQSCLLDVVTSFDPKDKGETNRGINDLLNYLGSIEHYYNIGVEYKNIDIKNLKMRRIKKELIKYLDSLDYNGISPEDKLIIDDFGFCGTFIPALRVRKEKKPILFALMVSPKDVEPTKAIEKRIKSKLTKYKWNGPVFVAICKGADFGVDLDNVAEILYGQSVLIYNNVTKDYFETIDKGGFVMPRGSNPPNNTSLTGILYCEMKWGKGLPTLQVKYLMNPFAKYPIQLSIPSYPRVYAGRIIFEWINNDDQGISHH
ncbi:hypothetical protein [Clostridium intestinale]|uniref:hypothetical protein n=1 Tax=Clostridium intestinale TaxID=36845 RepID=UPI0028F0B71F|nr:hypothetical protein [Clostridium intestinale]